jgi:hypothetical protein
VQIPVGQDYEPDILGIRVPPCLLFAHKGVVLLRLCFQNGEWKAAFVQEKVVNKSVFRFFEIVTQGIEALLGDFDVCFKRNISGAGFVVKEAPARPAKKVIDEDPRLGFLCRFGSPLFGPT